MNAKSKRTGKEYGWSDDKYHLKDIFPNLYPDIIVAPAGQLLSDAIKDEVLEKCKELVLNDGSKLGDHPIEVQRKVALRFFLNKGELKDILV